jgi:hypothetical protein
VQTLQSHLIPLLEDRPNTVFMQDNAPAHAAQVTKEFLCDNGIAAMA